MDRIWLQLGRVGDILNILPLAWMDAQAGKNVAVMAAKEFAGLLDGCSYVEKLVFDGPMGQLDVALRQAEALCKDVVVTQLVGPTDVVKNVVPYRNGFAYATITESFAKDQWQVAKRLPDWRLQPPLVFDLRSPEREAALVARLPDGPRLVLVAAEGHSSPFPYKKILLSFLRRGLGQRYDVVDLSAFRAERFYDLLGLFERARCLVSIDTAHLHLAYAIKDLPVVALVNDTPALWNGSPWRPNHIRHIRYGQFQDRCEEMLDAIKGLDKWGSYFSLRARNGHANLHHLWSSYDGPWHGTGFRFADVQTCIEPLAIGWDSVLALKDTKRFPFLKDVIRLGLMRAKEEDTLVLSRNDTCLSQEITPGTIGFAHRVQRGSWHPACDLFVFTKKWWESVRRKLPNFVMGRDWVWHRALKELMLRTGGQELPFTVQRHVPARKGEPQPEPKEPFQYVRHNVNLWLKFAKRNNIRYTYPPVEEQVTTVPLANSELAPYGYNPGLIRVGGRLLMVYRYHPTKRHSTQLRIADLGDAFQVLDDKPITMAPEPISMEDARFFTRRGQLWMSWVDSQWAKGDILAEAKSVVKYGSMSQNVAEWTIHPQVQPTYGKNDYSTMEKNWVFFSHEDTVYCIYQSSPEQVVLSFDLSAVPVQELRSPALTWLWGAIKGGTNPVPFGDKLLRFFHSTLDNEPHPWWRRYYLGAMLMEATPPFRPLRLSTRPIVRGSEWCQTPKDDPAACHHYKGNVVFPGGSVPDGDGWLVSVGINDCRCAILRLTEKDLHL